MSAQKEQTLTPISEWVLEPTLDLQIRVLEGLTSKLGTENFKPRESQFNENLVLKHLLKNITL